MCDPLSLTSAGTDLIAGFAGARQAKSNASFEAAQIEVASVMAGVRSVARQTNIRREFTAQAEQNVLAMAVSGLDFGSFDPITRGNAEERRRALVDDERTLQWEQQDLQRQKAVTLLQGRLDATASMFTGITSAAGTLADAEQEYQENHLGENRVDYAKRKYGLDSFFEPKE